MEYFNDYEITSLLVKEIIEKINGKGKNKNPSKKLYEAFEAIVQNVLKNRKYVNYTDLWKSDFKSLAYEKFIKHWWKFDPTKIQKNYIQRNNKKYFIEDPKLWRGAHSFFTTIVISSIHDVINEKKKEQQNNKMLAKIYDDKLKEEVMTYIMR